MPGFDALGRQALGHLPAGSVILQALTARICASGMSRDALTVSYAATARIGAQVKISDGGTWKSPISSRASAQAKAKATPGFALKTTINGQSKARVAPGLIFTARLTQRAYIAPDIHVQGANSGQRKPLLLDGTAPSVASYWKGNG